MTATPPEVHPDGRYNGTQTAHLLGISRETLRQWVATFKIRQRYSRRSTRPFYLGRDILICWKS